MDYIMEYIAYKGKVLSQLGLTDTARVENYLYKASLQGKTTTSMEIKIDQAARQLIMDYYDGDKSYVAKRH